MSSTEEQKAREVAEGAREKQWKGASFLKEVFLGNLRIDLLQVFGEQPAPRPEFTEYYEKLKTFLREKVDPNEIDRTGEYPKHVVEGLAALGAFGMKIPKDYGGLGLTHPEYVKVMMLMGSHDANVGALLSAHQAIGVPQPVRLFGSEELKREYLPRCAKGAISAFALTEPAVGSDPGSLQTVAEESPDGEHYLLNGQKLWCTNGTLAELLVVMARNPKTGKINAFVVETKWPGVVVEHRCHFMGLKALANAQIAFKDVKVPKKNLIGGEGAGLKIALVTLNTGRLTLPATTAGGTKLALEICRKWSEARVQWGRPVGQHEAIAHKLSDMATNAFAMESIAELLGQLADQKNTDIRLEAAAAKEWNTTTYWRMLDELLQIRGGRGYETESSLSGRGEPPVPVERLMRDARINLIFEGSSEIMHLFMAREAVDKHLDVAGALVNPKASIGTKLAALPKMFMFYAWWYPTRWLKWALWPKHSRFGQLSGHVRFAERASAALARTIFHGMALFQAKLERKQAFLFRAVDVAMELFAICAAVSKATALKSRGVQGADQAVKLADVFARSASRRVEAILEEMWTNEDDEKVSVARGVMDGSFTWLEQGTMGLPFTAAQLKPRTVQEFLADREKGAEPSKVNAA